MIKSIRVQLKPNNKQITKLFDWVRLCERGRIPLDTKCSNPRVTFDGINWWLSVGIEHDDATKVPTGDGIGIDLGITELAITSDGDRYKNINKSKEVKRLEKRKRLLQRKVANKYEIGKDGENRFTKTRNIIKLENSINHIHQRISNIRNNHMHQITSEIIKRKPSYIVIEDLNVSGMMKNRHLSKAIQDQRFYEFRRQIEYKSNWNNIEVIIADRLFPSSKKCSSCSTGYKKDLKLSDREYVCDDCGAVIDRDYNASLNLKSYGQSIVNH